MTAVPAERRHCPDFPVLASNDQKRLIEQGHCQIVADVWQLLLTPDAKPRTHEDGFALKLVERRRHVRFFGENARAGWMIDGPVADVEPIQDREHVWVKAGCVAVHDASSALFHHPRFWRH
jgi:hypothetical protein